MTTKAPTGKELHKKIKGRGNSLTTETVLEALIQQFGGVDKFAIAFKKDFDDAPVGGMARQRMMTMLTNMVEDYTKGRDKTEEGKHLLTDMDLIREGEQIAARIYQVVPNEEDCVAYLRELGYTVTEPGNGQEEKAE